MNILIISTYPIDKPIHGGQHRLYNIVQIYRQAGHIVQTIGVLGSDQYPTAEGFVAYPGTAPLTQYIANPFLMDDWAIGELFSKDDSYFNSLTNKVTIEPDLIHVEQPWLLQFAIRYIKTCTTVSPKIIYGSQNIEHQLKFNIVKSYMGLESAEIAKQKVWQCELDAISKADAILCVSENDLAWTLTQTQSPCILAPNGVTRRITTTNGIQEANKITGHRKFVLYCASAHPPNINGFFDIFGNGVGCISPSERIVIAGNGGTAIQQDSRFNRAASLSRVCVTPGEISESCLQGLLETAHAIILPITQGGGTNLKTAEAIWSGKHIIATTVAMRGFEKYTNSQGIYIADEAPQFLANIRDSLAKVPNQVSPNEHRIRESVLWNETLKPILAFISNI